jgi:hypothetical protein
MMDEGRGRNVLVAFERWCVDEPASNSGRMLPAFDYRREIVTQVAILNQALTIQIRATAKKICNASMPSAIGFLKMR